MNVTSLFDDPDGLLASSAEWLVKFVCAIGAIAIGYAGLWCISKLEVATSAMSRTALCCEDPKHRSQVKRHWVRKILSFEGFARVMLLILRCMDLLGAAILVLYIFGTNLSMSIGFPTFFALLAIAIGPLTQEYITGVSNAFESTSLQGQPITVEATYGRKMIGTILRMTATRVVMKDKDTADILLVPHTMFASSLVKISKDSDYCVAHDLN